MIGFLLSALTMEGTPPRPRSPASATALVDPLPLETPAVRQPRRELWGMARVAQYLAIPALSEWLPGALGAANFEVRAKDLKISGAPVLASHVANIAPGTLFKLPKPPDRVVVANEATAPEEGVKFALAYEMAREYGDGVRELFLIGPIAPVRPRGPSEPEDEQYPGTNFVNANIADPADLAKATHLRVEWLVGMSPSVQIIVMVRRTPRAEPALQSMGSPLDAPFNVLMEALLPSE